jgi:hypothetical protein
MLLRDTKRSAAVLARTGFAEPQARGDEPRLRPTEMVADIAWVLATGAAMAAVVLIVGWMFNQ